VEDKPEPIEYDPDDFPRLAVLAEGAGIYSSIEIKRSDVKQVKVTNEVFVSEESLKDSVEIEASGDDQGQQTYKVKGPRILLPRKCIRVNVVVTIPEDVTNMEELRVAFTEGELVLDKSLEKFEFKSFVVKAVKADFAPKLPVKGDKIVVELVDGGIKGRFHSQVMQAATVNGDIKGHFHTKDLHIAIANGNIKAYVDVDKQDEGNQITAKTVRGDIKLKVTKNFQGTFSLANFMGDTCVKGDDVEFDTKNDHHKAGKHVPKGEDVDEESNIKVEAISGDLALVFA